tara:strand:+ start:4295 stop:4519 length:225 start_codon:yes stop_codon:yes gene_type:complete
MSAWTKRVAKVLPNNGKLVEIISKRGNYFKIVSEPKPLDALNGKIGITLEDDDGFRFTTESRNVRVVQDSYYAR